MFVSRNSYVLASHSASHSAGAESEVAVGDQEDNFVWWILVEGVVSFDATIKYIQLGFV